MFKKLFPLILFVFLSTVAVRAQESSALILGGSFSAYANPSGSEQPFNQQMRDEEVAQMREDLQAGKFQEVLEHIHALEADNFLDDRFYLLKAIASDGLESVDEVITYAGEAIAITPQDSRAYLLRAGAYLKKGDYARARADLSTGLKLNPSSALAKNIQKELDEKDPSSEQHAAAQKQKNQSRQRWMYIYFVALFLGALLFLYCRYEDLFRQPKSAYARKEVEVKEQYDFIRQIGEGGMGQVYEAYDKVLKRKVAIKRVRPELVRSAYIREQFLSEARTLALLRHPDIVEVYTVIESEHSLYLVFEYVDGQTLETRLDIDGRILFSQAKEIFKHVCQGLAYAHSQNIIHCDLKPGNIMILDNNRAKVMDFGVARKSVDTQTGARTVAGTPAYMAPEQQKGYMKKQSDVYSLALCFYEALVGQVPWTVKGFNIADKKIVPPSKLAPFIPPQVDALIEKALKEDPGERTQSVTDFWKELEAIEPLKEDDPSQTHY